MAQQHIDFGTVAPNDGETAFTAFPKIEANTTELYSRVEDLEDVVGTDLVGVIVDTRNFGAVADGVDHPLSERYGTLAAAQAYYPRATSLAQSIDGHAIQKAYDTVGAAGGGAVFLGGGHHFVNFETQILCQYDHVSVFGQGLKIISDGPAHPVFVAGDFTDATKRADYCTWINIRFEQTETLVNPPNTTWFASGAYGAITDNHTSAAILLAMADNSIVDGCSFKNYLFGISQFSDWTDFTVQTSHRWENLTFDGCNFGIFPLGGLRNTTIRNIRNKNTAGVLIFVEDGTPDPPHAIYITGGRRLDSISNGVFIDGVYDENNPHTQGSAVKLKSVDGFRISNVYGTNATGGIDVLNCQNGLIDATLHDDLIEDSTVAQSQGAITLWGCADVDVVGASMTITGAGTQGVATRSLAKAAFTTPPVSDVPCRRITLCEPKIRYNASGASPLSAIYWEDCIDCHVRRPVIWRMVSQNAYMFNIQKTSADITPSGNIISDPTIIADSADPHRHKTFAIDTGVENTRILLNLAHLVNVDDYDAAFLADGGTNTIVEREMTYGNAGKARSGRTWNLTSGHRGIAENSSGTIFEIISGNANTASLYFGDTDASGLGRLSYDHSTNTLDIFTNSGRKMRINAAGVDLGSGSSGIALLQNATTVLDLERGLRLRGYSADNLNDSGNAVNTAQKAAGKVVYDSDALTPAFAVGSAAADVWRRLANLDGSQTLTNKSIDLGSNSVSGSAFDFNTALTGADFYTTDGTDVAVADGGTGASTAPGACANLGTWNVVAQSSVAVAHTGNTSETVLATVAIPAGAMGANGRLRVTTIWSYTNSANNKTMRARFGVSGAGTGGTSYMSSVQTTTQALMDQRVIGNRNSASSQVGGSSSATGGWGATATTAPITSAINTANASEVSITALLANSGETITLENYIVELFYAA